MSLLKLIKNGLIFLETAFLSRYSNPEKYHNYVVESGRQALAQEVASVVLTQGNKHKSKKLKVLDVAAGTGLISKALVDTNCLVVAFDHSAEMLTALSQQYKEIETRVGDMNQLWPFANAQFEAITIVWGNRYLVDTGQFASEAYRVLKPGGILVWPLFWLERPLWWFFLLKQRGVLQITSFSKLSPTGITKTLLDHGFSSTILQSRLQKEVGWWQKPVYVIAKKKPKLSK